MSVESPRSQYTSQIPWLPQEGPQEAAMFSSADVVLYGGAAGSGKTALACGMAITRHQNSLIMRREATQMKGIVREIGDIIDPARNGYSKQSAEWKIPTWDGMKRTVMLGSCPHLGDEMKWQGIARDLLVLDEAANFLESSAKFLMGWTRSTTEYDVESGQENYLSSSQRTRALLCTNPPTTSDGQWIREMFAAWIDPNHPNPANPGELRYYTTVAGKMIEQESGDPIENPDATCEEDKWIYPKSFTFIPGRVTDNKYLGADYMRELQALPEPLRSQMLLGSWSAGLEDAEYQVIPSEWVTAAQARWTEKPLDPSRVTSAGIDPSRGGKDETVLSLREGWHFHALNKWDGSQMKTGGDVAAKVVELVGTSMCPIHVDVIGIGASVLDHLTMLVGSRSVVVNASHKSEASDIAGVLSFANKRAELWWRFRDLLDPANSKKVALPPDNKLAAELCAPTYKLRPTGILIESKDDIKRRLGRSTDSADAVIMAAERTPIVSVTSGRRPNVRIISSLQ